MTCCLFRGCPLSDHPQHQSVPALRKKTSLTVPWPVEYLKKILGSVCIPKASPTSDLLLL